MKQLRNSARFRQAACRLLAGVLMVLCINCTFAKEYKITPADDVESLSKRLKPGDVVTLKDGHWKDAKLKFERLPGTPQSPIRVRAQTPGQVVFTGEAELRFSGSHVEVAGFVFRDTDGVSDVVQLRSHSKRHAHHFRLTDCLFEQTPKAMKGTESRWLSVYGTHNRVDHCYFGGKRSRGSTLVIWVSPDVVESHRIDHNHFGPRPDLGRNGGETIRIGTSETSEANCRTTVDSNYFHSCDGEAEIISNKSCENTYRHNVFFECDGALTLRHGHRCLVDANVFLGNKKNGTGGVRIIGEGHTVINNYFEGLRGDARRAALSVMNGIPDGPLNGFAPVRNATVSHNTFIDCKVTMEIGVDADKRQSAAAADCRFTHNLFLPGKWPIFRMHAQPVATVWVDNKHQTGRSHKGQLREFERVNLQLKRAVDGLLRPTDRKSLECHTSSEVKSDIDGQDRGPASSLAGCDVP